MHRTIAHGCSFTRYKWTCWPKFVSWFNGGIKMLNQGNPGSSNETISRAVINSVLKYSHINHLYIMWSGVDRYEVITDNKEEVIQGNLTYQIYDEDFKWGTWYGGHPDKDKHEYYRRHFWNEAHQYYRTLEHILRTQMFLDKKKIPYTMMLFKKDVLHQDHYSESERALHGQIDWSKFLFYKYNGGLMEFAEENYKAYYMPGDSHPPPIAHYHWVKDIMFESDFLCPKDEYDKLKNYFVGKNGRS